MNKILLKEIINSKHLLTDAGNIFYDKIKNAIETDEKLIVDMSEVTSLSSVFLNVSIGRIIDEKGIDALRTGMSFVMITKQQAIRLKEYVSRYNSAQN